MDYEVVFNISLGMLALQGCELVIIFWIVFREENAIHERSKERTDNPLRALIRGVAARVPGVWANAIAQTEEI